MVVTLARRSSCSIHARSSASSAGALEGRVPRGQFALRAPPAHDRGTDSAIVRQKTCSEYRKGFPGSVGVMSDCPGRRTVARSGLGPYSACLGAIPRPPCGADVYCASLPTVSPDTVVIPASGVFRAMGMELQMKHSSSLVSPHVTASSTLGTSAAGFNVRSGRERRHVAPCRHQPAHGERP